MPMERFVHVRAIERGAQRVGSFRLRQSCGAIVLTVLRSIADGRDDGNHPGAGQQPARYLVHELSKKERVWEPVPVPVNRRDGKDAERTEQMNMATPPTSTASARRPMVFMVTTSTESGASQRGARASDRSGSLSWMKPPGLGDRLLQRFGIVGHAMRHASGLKGYGRSEFSSEATSPTDGDVACEDPADSRRWAPALSRPHRTRRRVQESSMKEP